MSSYTWQRALLNRLGVVQIGVGNVIKCLCVRFLNTDALKLFLITSMLRIILL